jgi:Natural resistance-associated macrophage protein
VVFALLISWATVRLRCHQLANVLKWLVLVLFAYPITAFVVGADWGRVVRDTLVPSMPHTRDEWSTLVAILGTTISPYLFFWQASEEVEEEKGAGQSTLAKRRGATVKELQLRRMDVGVGTFFSNLVMFFIILTTAITLNRHGVTHIETTRQAAEALRPLAGKFAATLFAGIVGVGFLCNPDPCGISGIRICGNAGVAPRPGQEVEAGALVLHSHSSFNGSGCRTELRRHQSCEGTLLDSCHKWIVSPLPTRSNPYRRLGQEADAGPTKFTPGMDRRGDRHSGDVRRGRCHVCGVDSRFRRRAARSPDTCVQPSGPPVVLYISRITNPADQLRLTDSVTPQ